jgi:hypothetical protein
MNNSFLASTGVVSAPFLVAAMRALDELHGDRQLSPDDENYQQFHAGLAAVEAAWLRLPTERPTNIAPADAPHP